MKTTTPEGYPYPLDRDPSALGPQLQALAEAGDSRYGTDQRDDLGFVLDLMRAPSVVRRSTAAQGSLSYSVFHLMNFPALLFNTTGTAAGQTAVHILPTQPSGREFCWLFVGASLTATVNGAVTPASKRGLRLHFTLFDPVTGAAQESQYAMYESESPVAGQPTRLTIGVYLRAAAGTVEVYFDHDNVASDMTVAAGATVWMTRLSPQPLTL